MKVLVVDHEMFLAELVKLALEADGHACFTAASADEATEILKSVPIDLIALDLVTNGSNPLTWLEQTMLLHPELHGRAFVLTARPLEHADDVRVRASGARVIQKPFTLDELRETIRMITPAGAKKSDARPRVLAIET